MTQARILVFDVNETLLDVGALAPKFETTFGSAEVLSVWFSQLLRASAVLTLSGQYHDFGTVARHALRLVAAGRGIEMGDSAEDAILAGVVSLPPHPEVVEALTLLQEAGFRMTTLTNSATSALASQLSNANLARFFEPALSVDAVAQFKPAPATYRYAADKLGVPLSVLRMVAAHNWDTSGAIRAGCRAAFVQRPGMALGPLDETPDIIGLDLVDVAHQIIAIDRPHS